MEDTNTKGIELFLLRCKSKESIINQEYNDIEDHVTFLNLYFNKEIKKADKFIELYTNNYDFFSSDLMKLPEILEEILLFDNEEQDYLETFENMIDPEYHNEIAGRYRGYIKEHALTYLHNSVRILNYINHEEIKDITDKQFYDIYLRQITKDNVNQIETKSKGALEIVEEVLSYK
ncbi:hypothetical protein ACFL1H_08265 [Nanoarchaeota archaeon]